MEKWYESEKADGSVIISGRIRLARNVKKYPFSGRLNNEAAENMINEVTGAIINDRNPIGQYFQKIDLRIKNETEKKSMLERHNISLELMNKKQGAGLLLKDDECVSIMLNEEDHIRIQAIFAGENIDTAYDLSNKIDDLIEESIEYAFDKDFGYLTACPTNTGTGMRASYMLHIPMLEMTGQFKNIVIAISKFGITARGIYGEGSESLGCIYQVSNQVTIGKSEQEIINSLKNVTSQIIEQETKLRERLLKNSSKQLLDKIYRSFGVLENARKISRKEAMERLSDVRAGYLSGLEDLPKLNKSIYQIMMNIQPGNLQLGVGKELTEDERDILRADYLRGVFRTGRESHA